jgi:cell wall-associated NlpC family hydrolase
MSLGASRSLVAWAGMAILLSGGCARHSRVRVAPPTTRASVPPHEEERPRLEGESIAATAVALIGVPYRTGGADLAGFDCSGFVAYVFARHGVGLPRSVGEQFQIGARVARAAIVAGDLVFFSIAGGGPSHVGIATGRETFVHAPSTNGQVRTERLDSSYWSPKFVGARRVAPPVLLTRD